MKSSWDTALTLVLVVCAVATTGVVVYRQFAPRAAAPSAAVDEKLVFVADWRSHLGQGVALGPSDAPVQLMEFADFECPFCSRFESTLEHVKQRYPKQVALTFVHLPLPMHRFAMPAARAAECAADQQRFQAMETQLFRSQDSFGLQPWSDQARAAGVPDVGAFEACVSSTEPLPRVKAGQALAEKLGVRATPTLIVNGWRLTHPPSTDELDAMVERILAGKEPVPSADRGG